MSEHPPASSSDRIEVQSSRLWALLRFRITEAIFCNTMAADAVGISLVKVTFWNNPLDAETNICRCRISPRSPTTAA